MFALFALALLDVTRPDAPIVHVRIDGAIGPASALLLERAIAEADAQHARALVVGLDTPGGLADSMQAMVQQILASPVEVVVWVSPEGARAASAGTFLLYAAHVAAMAPATHAGAATPVALGGFPGSGGDDTSALEGKAREDAAAGLRALAERRGRSVEFAEQAVQTGASLSADEALAKGVIDVIAPDLHALKAHLSAEGAPVIDVDVDWRVRLLSILTHPNVAYLLLLLGFYGLLFELSNPGMIFPGVAGAVALVLALFALHLLPVSYAGIALLLLGAALMVAEALTPSFGALGVGGIASFFIGSLLLFEGDVPGFTVSRPLIVLMAALSAAFLIGVVRIVFRTRGRPVVSGREQLLRGRAVAAADFQRNEGPVRIHGETWRARSDAPVAKGDVLDVVGLSGLTLRVRRRAGGIA